MFHLSLLALCCVSLTSSLPTKPRVIKLDVANYPTISPLKNRIINGVDSEQTPWVARIVTSYQSGPDGTSIGSICGGSLISSHYVLTARHCIYNENNEMNSKTFWVSVGDVDYFKGKIIPISEIAVFNANSNDDDVALLKMVNDADGIEPIPVQYDDNIDYGGQTAQIWGWGETETGEGTQILKTTNVVLYGREDCGGNSVCFNPEITNTNACSGDSGGPMVLDGKLIGVTRAVSVVNDQPCTGDKTFYSSTAWYGDWIQGVINA